MIIAQAIYDALEKVFLDGVHWLRLEQSDYPETNVRPAIVLQYNDAFNQSLECGIEERRLLLMTTIWVKRGCCGDDVSIHEMLHAFRKLAHDALTKVFGWNAVRISLVRAKIINSELTADYAESVDFTIRYTTGKKEI